MGEDLYFKDFSKQKQANVKKTQLEEDIELQHKVTSSLEYNMRNIRE
jgi:hypothetical protein